MKYQFIETELSYWLALNGQIVRRLRKDKYSKQEAETAASEVVVKEIKKGRKVEYDGLICC